MIGSSDNKVYEDEFHYALENQVASSGQKYKDLPFDERFGGPYPENPDREQLNKKLQQELDKEKFLLTPDGVAPGTPTYPLSPNAGFVISNLDTRERSEHPIVDTMDRLLQDQKRRQGIKTSLLNKPNIEDYIPPKDLKRAPIEQKYEDMPTSTKVEDRRDKSDWVDAVSKEYTGFSTKQWGEVWDAIMNRPFEPMEKPLHRFMKLLPLKAEGLSKELGYEDLSVPISKTDAPYEPFWSPLR